MTDFECGINKRGRGVSGSKADLGSSNCLEMRYAFYLAGILKVFRSIKKVELYSSDLLQKEACT